MANYTDKMAGHRMRNVLFTILIIVIVMIIASVYVAQREYQSCVSESAGKAGIVCDGVKLIHWL